MKSKWTRRQMLQSTLSGTVSLALRSLATGIPASVLLDPFSIAEAASTSQQRLILLNSHFGDPLNCNVPGLYGKEFEGIIHPANPIMKPTPLSLAGKRYTAAKPWSTIPQEFLNKMVFIHHATRTPSHNNHHKVLKLLGAMKNDEMSFSLYSKALANSMKTIQAEPIALGGVNVSFNGRILSIVSPESLNNILKIDTTNLGKLQDIRDQELNNLYRMYKQHGTTKQRQALNLYARSRRDAKKLSTNLLHKLSKVESNDQNGQVIAAPILLAMNVAPVISLQINFGRDNHSDLNLEREAEEHVTGLAAINTILQGLKDLNLDKKVTIASMNVFGRDLQKKGTIGRDHNSLHHCTFIIGEKIKAGVVGSVQKTAKDWSATPINSNNGKGSPDGDISVANGLASVGKTLGMGLGVESKTLNEHIESGKVIRAALKPS